MFVGSGKPDEFLKNTGISEKLIYRGSDLSTHTIILPEQSN